MTISDAILNQHPDLDDQQLSVIGHHTGPALVLAGPGSGKTASICLRAVNLLLQGRATPRNMLLCTFTRAAALEMRQRLIAGAQAAGYSGDLANLRVTTIHSLCHQVLSNLGTTVAMKTPDRVINAVEQLEFLRNNFDVIFASDTDALVDHGWSDPERIVNGARRFFDRIADELIDPQELIDSGKPFRVALGQCNQRYLRLLHQKGLIDFAGLQTNVQRLLDNPGMVAHYGGVIRHLLVDEYQDTNRAQQHILSRLAETHGNICVVGDEDQLIYAFRGANPYGFDEFRRQFPDASTFELAGNYRSHRDVVAVCNTWIGSFNWSNPDPGQMPFRQPKYIEPRANHAEDNHPGVLTVVGVDRGDEAVWLADLLSRLKDQNFIGSYDEVAVLLPSVKSRYGDVYADALRCSNIPVYRDRIQDPFGEVGGPGDNTPHRTSRRSHPAGHVLLTTIHQAKGREWPVVCTAGLHLADLRPSELDVQLGPHLPRPPAYSSSRAAELDLGRQYYVAFSRAQRLLILSAARNPHKIFRPAWCGAVPREDVDQRLLSGPGKFVAEDTRPSSSAVSNAQHIVVPASSTLVLRANIPGPPDLVLHSRQLRRTSPPAG
ncbi:MAG: UvrD-helicase domain-containing protein [Chloroflexi bacterium]|nr:UvrD-helicase domain-containing protein [Chloroflexota bacterium]